MRGMSRIFALSLGALSVVALDVALAPPSLAADRLFFEGDMVRGRPKTGPTGPVCVLNSQFKRGEKVVWRVRVFDGTSAKQLDKSRLASVMVELPDGKKLKGRFGTHPPKHPVDSYWTVAWQIPAKYPTGSFGYKVVATELGGKVHSWKPFGVKSSQFTVIAGKVNKKK